MQIQGYDFSISAAKLEETLGGYLLTGKTVQIGHPFGRTLYFKHGWQSWSEAGWVSLKENPKPIVPPERRPQCDDPAYALSPVHGGSGLGVSKVTTGGCCCWAPCVLVPVSRQTA